MTRDQEIQFLDDLKSRPLLQRWLGYSRFTGPGFFQSAITLGGGTASACFVAGSGWGYQLLWVQPVAMLLGIVLMAAIAHQTLHSGERTYRVFQTRFHPLVAVLFALSTLVANIIWHFPQYGVATNAIRDAGAQFGVSLNPWAIAVPILMGSILICWTYDTGARGIRIYEIVMKTLVWSCVITFGIVAFRTGIQWDQLWGGLLAFQIPDDPRAVTTVIGAMSAAVGINMIFLYPYSLLRKEWNTSYKGAAHFDLMTGMFLPYLLATTFIIVGTANTIHLSHGEARGPMDLVPVLSDYMSPHMSALLLGAGLFAMGLSSITVQMLTSGFVVSEMFGLPLRGWPYRLGMLVPAVGILGATFKSPFWASILAASFAVIFMPLTMVLFLYLLNNRDYMREARPVGLKAWLWNGILAISILIMTLASIVTYRGRIAALLG